MPDLFHVFDQADARERGRAQGEAWRAEIRSLAALRKELAWRRGRLRSEDVVEQRACALQDMLRRHAPDALAELIGVAEGADLPPDAVVILNAHPELTRIPAPSSDAEGAPDRDTEAAEVEDPEGSTAIYFLGRDGAVLGQTFDLHHSARPFVRLVRLEPAGGPAMLCVTLTGVLALGGVNERGLALTVNDLRSTDARAGVPWPAVVRGMLAAPHAAAARERLESMPRAGGHHVMLADGSEFQGIETTATQAVRTQVGERAGHLHTNHCFDPVLRRYEDVPRQSTTFHRINLASSLYAMHRPRTTDDLWDLLHTSTAERGSLCRHVGRDARGDDDPHAPATCAVVVMRPGLGWLRLGVPDPEAPTSLEATL